MSHTTIIKSVPIKDIQALHSAVEELNLMGVRCELRTNEKPRMYYEDQYGATPYTLYLHDSKYDVGFCLEQDGSYSMVCDLHGNHIQKQVGCACSIEGASRMEQAVGKLTQLYVKHATINAAVSQGYVLDNCYVDDDGNLQMEISVG